MTKKLLLLGESHNDPSVYIELTKQLSSLHGRGLRRVFMELTQDNGEGYNTPEALIREESSLVYRALPHYKGRDAWFDARIGFFNKLLELEVDIVAIDVSNPENYLYPGGPERRNLFMVNKITEHIKVNEFTVVMVGAGHLLNTFQKNCYDYGLVHLLCKKPQFSLENLSTIVISKERSSKEMMDFKKRLEQTAPEIESHIRIEDTLNLEVAFNTPSPTNRSTYATFLVALNPDDPLGSLETIKYMKDLGAESSGDEVESCGINARAFKIKGGVTTMNSARRKLLGLDAVSVKKKPQPDAMNSLTAEIPGLHVNEKCDSNGNSRWCLSFFSTSNLAKDNEIRSNIGRIVGSTVSRKSPS